MFFDHQPCLFCWDLQKLMIRKGFIMAKTCVTEKSAQRQRWIENGLLEMMLIQKLDEISVSDLCRHLKLSRRSFYRYFEDLEDVLDSLMNHTFQDLALTSKILDFTEMLQSYEFWIHHRELLDALNKSGLINKLYEYTFRYTDSKTINRHLAPDDIHTDIHQEVCVFVISGFVSLIIAWFMDGFRKTPEQMAQIAQRMLFSPILKN